MLGDKKRQAQLRNWACRGGMVVFGEDHRGLVFGERPRSGPWERSEGDVRCAG